MSFISIEFALTLQYRERHEHKIFLTLLKSVPGLEERLVTGSDDEAGIVAELVSCASIQSAFFFDR